MGVKETVIGFGNTGYAPARAQGAAPAFNSLQEQITQGAREPKVPCCYVYLTGTQNITSGIVSAVVWNAVVRNYTDVNSNTMWTSGASSALVVIPPEFATGWWDIQAHWRWPFTTAGGRRVAIIHSGAYGNPGLVFWDELAASTSNVGVTHCFGGKVLLNAGDDVRMSVFQDSGITLAGGRANGSTKHHWEGSLIVRWHGPDDS